MRGLGAASRRRGGLITFPSEVISAFLRAARRDRITADEAREAIRDLLALPFVLCDVTAIADQAFAIASQHQQRAYDCLYVARAEREEMSYELVMRASTMRCTPQEPDSRARYVGCYPGVKASLYGQFLSFI